jgi:coatomer protein complex subunit gamma
MLPLLTAHLPHRPRLIPPFVSVRCNAVKRWVNETHEAVDAKSSASFFGSGSAGSYLGFESSTSTNSGYQPMPSTIYIAQYHVPGLLYLIRRQNRMAVTKMIRQIDGGKPGSGAAMENPMALSMLIRYVAKVVEEDQK